MKQAGPIETRLRLPVHYIARLINTASRGKVTANHVTISSVLIYVVLAVAISRGNFVITGIGVLVFGLFDTLDGELSRLQKRQSQRGAFLDSVTDRIKEALVYIGLATYWASTNYDGNAISGGSLFPYESSPWIVIALSISLLISYVNASGDANITNNKKKSSQTNSAFRVGIMTYPVRITLLGLGLIFNQVLLSLIIISVLGIITLAVRIKKVLGNL